MNLLFKKNIAYSIIAIICLGQFTSVNAQNFVADDDPVAAMLDSLATKKILENAYSLPVTPKNNKFHFAADSVPRYEDYVYENRLSKLDVNSPFDLQYHESVKGYIELYTVRKRTLVSRMIALSQLYYPMFEEVLDKYNMPLELKHLAVIESALNPLAKSRAGAMGLWQFMYPTGKMYGLNVTSYVDERCDPYKETIAAAEYLQFLYKMFGDWQMVLAAYNGGPGTINRAIRRSGGKKTYWEIRPYLPKETQGYVPAFIAANYVMNYYPEHNIYPAIPKKTYFELDTVVIKEPLTFEQLSGVLDVPVDEIQYFNPIYKKNVIPAGGNVLTLPKSKIGKFVSNENQIYALLHQQSEQQKIAENYVKEKQISHTVRKNEKLAAIAKKYGVTVADLKNWNFIGKKGIQPGRKLVVYVKEQQAVQPASENTQADNNLAQKNDGAKAEPKKLAENNSSKASWYKVKKGDSMYKIAKDNDISIEELKKLNKLTNKSKLVPGQKLKLKQVA
ncbi:MAG: transglycosylase SLT domain-containing protein [Bacteroidia bacterium]